MYYRLQMTGVQFAAPDLFQTTIIEDVNLSVDFDVVLSLPPMTSPYANDHKIQTLYLQGPRDASFLDVTKGLSWLKVTNKVDPNGESLKLEFCFYSDSSLAGTYSMLLKLTNKYGVRDFHFNIMIEPSTKPDPPPPAITISVIPLAALSNLGPPNFVDSFETMILLTIGESKTLQLPSIEDPDGDSFIISVDKCLAFFCTQSSSGFTFKNLDTRVTTTFTVKVTLKDLNEFPKFSVTSISITLQAPATSAAANNALSSQSNTSSGSAQQISNNSSQQSGGSSGDSSNESADLQVQISVKKEKCKLNIKSVDRQGRVTLRIYQCSKASEIVQMLTKKDLEATVINKGRVNFDLIGDVDIIQMILNLNGMAVSNSQELDMIRVKVVRDILYEDAYSQVTLSGKAYSDALIPPILSASQQQTLEKMQQAQQKVGLAMLPISFALSFIMSFFIQFIFSLLNDLSALMLLSLLPIYSPGLAQPIQSTLLGLIQLDLLQTDKWLPQVLFPDEVDDGPLNECFGMGGYSSQQSLLNAGSSFLYLGLIGCGFAMLGILSAGACHRAHS
ncbi:hypothetical protein FGO68_gene12768 [Halteria grandinella]|uniref:Cadherin domain-containing protein n=1 Tax=Halteria grandinella TaxID=5974 RepID=A0A8J8P5Y4_HALGN|nr:hypothetical protein FGO68_gene12768 [Halteria grandinella]